MFCFPTQVFRCVLNRAIAADVFCFVVQCFSGVYCGACACLYLEISLACARALMPSIRRPYFVVACCANPCGRTKLFDHAFVLLWFGYCFELRVCACIDDISTIGRRNAIFVFDSRLAHLAGMMKVLCVPLGYVASPLLVCIMLIRPSTPQIGPLVVV